MLYWKYPFGSENSEIIFQYSASLICEGTPSAAREVKTHKARSKVTTVALIPTLSRIPALPLKPELFSP
jgi:hypothetical protein